MHFAVTGRLILMDLQPVYYEKSEYVETATGNKVNRKSRLFGSQNIVLNGKVRMLWLSF